MTRDPRIGDEVLYVAPDRRRYRALVTARWKNYGGVEGQWGLNVVFVERDPAKHDSYGRQISRDTSVPLAADEAWQSAAAIGRCCVNSNAIGLFDDDIPAYDLESV